MQFKTCALPKCRFLQNSSLKHRISFHLSKYSVGQQCWWQHFSFWGQSSWLLHSFNVRKHTPLLTCLTLKQKRVTPISKILSVLPTYLMVELANKVCSDFFGSLQYKFIFSKMAQFSKNVQMIKKLETLY